MTCLQQSHLSHLICYPNYPARSAPSFFMLLRSILLLVVLALSLFVTMPRQQRFRRGSATAFLFTGADMCNSNGGASKQLCPLDEPTKTSPYVCFACGFEALDDPALQFHLKGSAFCFENITGKKQRTAPSILSPRSLNHLSTTSNHAGHSSAISFPVVSPDLFFDYTLPDYDNYHDDDHPDHVNSDCEDDGEVFGEPLFLDQDADEDQENQQVLVDKYDIDQSHELKEDNTFPSSVDDVVHLELATICKDGNFPLKTFDEILQWAQRAHLRGYRFPVHAPSYETFLTKLADRLEMDDFKAELVTVVLVGGGTLMIPVFDFVTMFRSLLDDPRIRPYLMINWDCPKQASQIRSTVL